MPIRRASATIFGGLLGAVILSGLNVAACGQEATTAAHLSQPVRIEAADGPIDIEGGGAAPWYGDFDGDGRADLLVGQREGGKLRIYRNGGSNQRPRFDKFEWFRAGGGEGHVTPFQSTGFVPQLADFDDDGEQDILTCSGDGSIVVFYRQQNGEFAAGAAIRYALKPDAPAIECVSFYGCGTVVDGLGIGKTIPCTRSTSSLDGSDAGGASSFDSRRRLPIRSIR